MTESLPDPPEHHLACNGDPVYGWSLVCNHPTPGRWFSADEGGEFLSDDCWVQSWWGELGTEMVSDDAWPIRSDITIPVDVEGTGWTDGPTIVPAASRPDVAPQPEDGQ